MFSPHYLYKTPGNIAIKFCDYNIVPNCKTSAKNPHDGGHCGSEFSTLFNLFIIWLLNKTKGGLKFASTPMFQLINSVEHHFLDFGRSGRVFKPHSFTKILHSICCDELPRVGCDTHYLPLMSTLIYDYLVLRFKCVGKRTPIDLRSKSRAVKHSKKKQSRVQEWWVQCKIHRFVLTERTLNENMNLLPKRSLFRNTLITQSQ